MSFPAFMNPWLVVLARFSWPALAIGVASIAQRRRDHIRATGPLSQIDDPATLAAERELRVRTLHRLLADGTTKSDGALTGHRTNRIRLKNFRHQIVIVRSSDLATVKFARLRLQLLGEIVDQHLSIDFGSVHSGASFEQDFSFF